MLMKIAAPAIAVIALIAVAAPAQAELTSSDTSIISLCDGKKKKGDKEGDKKPAETTSPVAFCEGGKKGKKKEKGSEEKTD